MEKRQPWMLAFFAVLLFVAPIYADCGEPHGSPPEPSGPSEPSTAPSGPSGSGVNAPPADLGGSAKDHIGVTFDPSQQEGGKSVVDTWGLYSGDTEGKENLAHLELMEKHLKKFKVDPFMWRGYLKYVSEMSDLHKAQEEARAREYIRKVSWARQSGLEEAEERYQEATKETREAVQKYRDAEDKALEATHATAQNRDQHGREVLRDRNERSLEERVEVWKKIVALDKELKDLKAAEREAYKNRAAAKEELHQLAKQEARELSETVKAHERYKAMEANYEAAKNVSTPIPQQP